LTHEVDELKKSFATTSQDVELLKSPIVRPSIPLTVPSSSVIEEDKACFLNDGKPLIAFGIKDWEDNFGPIGIEPPLSLRDIHHILNALRRLSNKISVDNLFLTLIPATVNGIPFTVDLLLLYLNRLSKEREYGIQFCDKRPRFSEKGDKALERSYWLLTMKYRFKTRSFGFETRWESSVDCDQSRYPSQSRYPTSQSRYPTSQSRYPTSQSRYPTSQSRLCDPKIVRAHCLTDQQIIGKLLGEDERLKGRESKIFEAAAALLTHYVKFGERVGFREQKFLKCQGNYMGFEGSNFILNEHNSLNFNSSITYSWTL
ncbi:MAG: hypothetical protein ACHQUC_09425, partial [Chlamydiales bacterium]